MWCGTEIFKDPKTNLVWTFWENCWFVLQGPDPRTNEWDKNKHRWLARAQAPSFVTQQEQVQECQEPQPQDGDQAAQGAGEQEPVV